MADRTAAITPTSILGFCCLRNEIHRLPYFLEHYRALGVDHFFFVDNGSDDESAAYLAKQADVSLWATDASYRMARFGMDWLGWLQARYAHGHWALTVDADELLIYPHYEARKLNKLTAWLDEKGYDSFGALLLDLYPKGPVADQSYQPGDDPAGVLSYFDPDSYRAQWHPKLGNLWIQGGTRERVFFKTEPQRAPTLNKTPLVKWNRRFAYVTSTHQILPPRLHDVFSYPGKTCETGILLHTKFLPNIAEKSQEELVRQQHFQNTALYAHYHKRLAQNPDLWHAGSCKYDGWQQLVDLGLMTVEDKKTVRVT